MKSDVKGEWKKGENLFGIPDFTKSDLILLMPTTTLLCKKKRASLKGTNIIILLVHFFIYTLSFILFAFFVTHALFSSLPFYAFFEPPFFSPPTTNPCFWYSPFSRASLPRPFNVSGPFIPTEFWDFIARICLLSCSDANQKKKKKKADAWNLVLSFSGDR